VTRPIKIVVKAAEMIVAVVIAAKAFGVSMATDRMLGLTKMMYAMVINVVIPAIISVRTLEPCSLSLKNFSNIHFPPDRLFIKKSRGWLTNDNLPLDFFPYQVQHVHAVWTRKNPGKSS
jgi:hypothetical protein